MSDRTINESTYRELVAVLDDLINWMPRVEPPKGMEPQVDASIERACAALATLQGLSPAQATTIDMLLYCPNCGMQHVDAPDQRTPDWKNEPHRSHLCHYCKTIWRPADIDTNGVEAIKTKGKADTWDAAPAATGSPPSANPPGFVKPDNDKQVFFYEQDFYVLSNFSAFNLAWSGLIFPTSEHCYHWLKFSRAGDDQHDIRARIRLAPSAHEAFKIAEANKALRRADWDAVKVELMRDILRAKAAQHEYVRRKLLATGDRKLIEDSWRDDFWGWGPNRDGQNMLGKLWMEVRAELRAAMSASTTQTTQEQQC